MSRRQRSFCKAFVENAAHQLPATLAAILVAMLLVPVLTAQVITGQLTGRITDISGNVVRGVQVAVK